MKTTDGDIVRWARQIDYHLDWVRDLYREIERSGHPNADAIIAGLDDNYIGTFAWATHVVASKLEHPERWETGDFGIRHKVATKAAENRK